MPAEITSGTGGGGGGGGGGGQRRPKKTKLEKIAELESSLKLAREENRQLRKDLHVLKGITSNGKKDYATAGARVGTLSPSKAKDAIGDVDKMKDALKALKKVTVNQEMSLQTYRTKANERRKELKEKDVLIVTLQRQVKRLQLARRDMESNGTEGEGHLKQKLDDLQRLFVDEERTNVDLNKRLHESEEKVSRLSRQLNKTEGMLLHRSASSQSLKSVESVTTTQELDLARMKKELASKSNRIIELEMEMETVKDELLELQQKQQRRHPNDASFNDDLPSGSIRFDAFGGPEHDGFSSGNGNEGGAFGDQVGFASTDPFAGNEGSNDEEYSLSEDDDIDFW